MKRFIIPALLLLGVSLSAQNIDSRVIFTLGQDEELFCAEENIFLSTRKDRYCCVVRNTETGQLSMIWNGNRMVTADTVRVCYLDLYDFDNCVYSWGDREEDGSYRWTIKTCDGVFGPYDDILYVPDMYPFNLCKETGLRPDLPGWLYRECIMFSQFGQTFLYRNGVTLKLGPKSAWNYLDDLALPCLSPNGKHYAKLENDYLDYDGSVIPFTVPEGAVQAFAQPLDNGDVYVCYNFNDALCSFLFDHVSNTFGGIRRDEAYYDFSTMELVSRPYGGNPGFMRFHTLWAGLTIRDRSGDHIMSIDTSNNFVNIDGADYGQSSPILARYDADADAFVWLAVEGREVVYYLYRL